MGDEEEDDEEDDDEAAGRRQATKYRSGITTSVSTVLTRMPKMSEIARPLKIGSSRMKSAPSIAARPVSTIGCARVAAERGHHVRLIEADSVLGGQFYLRATIPTWREFQQAIDWRRDRLKALGVATPKRSPLAPEVPTLEEAGLVGFAGGTWFGILAPAKTPAPIVDRLAKEIATTLRAPDVVQSFTERGIEPVGSSPAEFRAFIESETRRWLKVAQGAGINPE